MSDKEKKGKTVTFTFAKAKRNELELPRLYFVVVDQWLDVIGEKAFISWLKFYSWADRSNDDTNKWNEARVPVSFNALIKRLGVGKDTFYNKILKPLWNVGLIDLEEYEDSENEGNKPVNIIVYKYPQNNIALASKPLEKIRNYDTDYSSRAKTFAKLGGRPKKDHGNGSETEPGGNKRSGVVLKQNQGGFSNRTGGGSEPELNNSVNLLNKSRNQLNNITNSSSSKGIKNNQAKRSEPRKNEEEEERLNRLIAKIESSFDFKVTEIIKRSLTEWIKRLPYEIINAEIDNCVLRNAKSWAYIERTFEEDLKLGIQTVEQLEEKIRRHKEKKANSNNSMKKPIRKEIVPDWFNDWLNEWNHILDLDSQKKEMTKEEFLREKAKLEQELKEYSKEQKHT